MFLRSFFARAGGSLWLVALCVFGFCATTKGQGTTATASGTNQTAPSVLAAATPVRSEDSVWVLSPNDVVSMTVFQEDDLSVKTSVAANGVVMLPLLGEVKIGGLTLSQATARIQQLYGQDYLVKPQINLTVEKFAARRFSVMGQVQRPGSFDFPQNESVNLLEAIAMAGGYTRLGAPSKVSVRRMENETPQIYRLNADEMAQDLKNKSFQILPNDVITVGERIF